MKDGKIKVWLPTVRAGSGTDVFTVRLAQALEARGMSVQVDWFSLRYEVAPIALSRMPAPQGTDIIFANSWNGFAFKRPYIPLVVTSFHPEFTASDPQFGFLRLLYHRILIRRYQELSFRAANALTAISAFTARSLQNTSHAEKLRIIYLWIDLEKFRPSLALPEKHKPFRLLFVGNLSYRKGADLLPAIMRELGTDFELSIIANPKNAKELNFPPNTTLLGRVSEDELVAAYQRCDALLFPSRWEGFGYTALEAMACGKPVVTSDASALPEVVLAEETGILCPAGDVKAFAAACRRLRDDPSLGETMGANGRKRAMATFSEETLVDQYVAMIGGLCP